MYKATVRVIMHMCIPNNSPVRTVEGEGDYDNKFLFQKVLLYMYMH